MIKQRSEKGKWVWEPRWMVDERDQSRGVTICQYLSDCRLHYLDGLVWSCCNFATTYGYPWYSWACRVFSHPDSADRRGILARDTIQIKYPLRRTLWLCRVHPGTLTLQQMSETQCVFYPGASENIGPYGKQAKYVRKKLQDMKLSCWFRK